MELENILEIIMVKNSSNKNKWRRYYVLVDYRMTPNSFAKDFWIIESCITMKSCSEVGYFLIMNLIRGYYQFELGTKTIKNIE